MIYKLFFPPNSEPDSLQGMTGALELVPCTSSPLSFPLLPALLQAGILTVGMDPGSQNPHRLMEQKTGGWQWAEEAGLERGGKQERQGRRQ